MSKISYKKIFSLHDPHDILKSKNAGIFEGSDGKLYVCDGKNPPMSFQQGSTVSFSESTEYDEDLKAFVIKK